MTLRDNLLALLTRKDRKDREKFTDRALERLERLAKSKDAWPDAAVLRRLARIAQNARAILAELEHIERDMPASSFRELWDSAGRAHLIGTGIDVHESIDRSLGAIVFAGTSWQPDPQPRGGRKADPRSVVAIRGLALDWWVTFGKLPATSASSTFPTFCCIALTGVGLTKISQSKINSIVLAIPYTAPAARVPA